MSIKNVIILNNALALQRRFGKWMKHPMVAASRNLTLNQLMEMAGVWLPKKTIQDTWQELSQL